MKRIRNIICGKGNGVKHQILIYAFIFAIGVILCLCNWDFLGGVGSSLIATAIVSGTLLYFLYDYDSKYDFNEKWGLEEIHENRRICISKTSFPRKNLDIIAFGLSHFINENQDIEFIANRIIEGLTIRIVTLHPESFYVERQKEFENTTGNISQEIAALNAWVVRIQNALEKDELKSKISIRYYNNIPLCFYCRADDHIYTGQYLPGKESNALLTYEFNSDGRAAKRYNEMFERIWEKKQTGVKYINSNAPRIKSDLKRSIETILACFANKFTTEKNVSVVGVVVIFKEDKRRTFYSCNKEPGHESHFVYPLKIGAFGDVMDLNKTSWIGDNQQALIFKDYKNSKYIVKRITARQGTTIKIEKYKKDKDKMKGKVNAVIVAPLIRNKKMFGAVTFDFVGLPEKYVNACNSDKDIKDIMNIVENWFVYAEDCAKVINHSIGTPDRLEFDTLFDEDWVVKP